MTLTPRQILILVVLIVGFAVAAYVVSRDETGSNGFDQARWCDEADRLEGAGALLRGTAADVTVVELDTLKDEIFAVETLAPPEIWDDLAALADFLLIAGQQVEDLDWPDAYVAARANKEERLDTAIDELELALATCGLRLD